MHSLLIASLVAAARDPRDSKCYKKNKTSTTIEPTRVPEPTKPPRPTVTPVNKPTTKRPEPTPAPSGVRKGRLTWNNFSNQGAGTSGAGACFAKFYPDNVPVVALATAAFAGGKNCGKQVTIYANGRSTKAMVVDMCDTERDGCIPDTVDASKAVWWALGINLDIGVTSITYSV
ncbi:hypothetical protein EDD86DRAFT_140647 [Gorgonomyces haynaldii]|nr:hypothetical protein EDD86DRAFT_140647 [Gorgonomyces haynaldii]